MLTILGLGMIMCFMYLIMSKRLSALVALTLIPIIFALLTYVLSLFVDNLAGFDIAELGNMMMEGIKKLAPTGVMLLFAILYFAIMIDTGLFDPSVKWILKQVKGDPLKVTLGTITLTLIVSLDGDGSTTYMICVAAMLPLYKRIGMSPLIMACLMMLRSDDACERNHELNPMGWTNSTCCNCITCRSKRCLCSDDFTNARCNWLVILPRLYVWPYGA